MPFPGEKAPRWHLKPLGKLGLPPTFEVGAYGLTLGRDPSNGVVLDPERFPKVSAHHTRVEVRGQRLLVTDLGSANGTLVNGRAVESQEVDSGALIQLGDGGPRFVAVHSSVLEQTNVIRPDTAPVQPSEATLGQTAILNLRRALGIDADAVKLGRRNLVLIRVIALALVALTGFGIWSFVQSRKESSQTHSMIAQQTERIEEINRGLAADLESRLTKASERLEAEVRTWNETRTAWEGQRAQLEQRREELASNIERIEKEGSASTVELASLKTRLEDTTHSLERLDPVNLEQARLAQLRPVRSAVVLIETTLMFRDPATKELVYVGSDEFGRRRINSERDGELLQRSSTGSGFCVRGDGLIVTNAHVVHPPDFAGMMFDETESFETVVELQVVFTESDQRHAAELVNIAQEGDEDVALIRITPFEGMPVLTGFDPKAAVPEPGSEVYLFGFPLGTYAVQEGDRVIASTLKGILSRRVGPYIQVDAGVHPGLSGGPATDASGHVIGLVTSVQATPMGDIVAVIGYVLPIAGVEKIWPKD